MPRANAHKRARLDFTVFLTFDEPGQRTVRNGIRICPVNFRTRLEHMDVLFRTLRRECVRAALARGSPGRI